MAAQLTYTQTTPKGVPGGKFDLAFDEVVSRTNEAADGGIKFGMAVAIGTVPGHTVKAATNATAAQIDGVVVATQNVEHAMKGGVVVLNNATLNVMKKGNIWGRTSELATPVYGSKAYVIVDGDETGYFTSNSSATSAYVECESTETGAKEIVSDDTESPTSSQIKLSAVTPVLGDYVPAVGDYVVSKQVHGATIDIGATFGKEADDGIAVIVLK